MACLPRLIRGKRVGDRSGESRRVKFAVCLALAWAIATAALGQPTPSAGPTPTPGDYVIHGFIFQSGETLPALRIHYTTFGAPQNKSRLHSHRLARRCRVKRQNGDLCL